MSNTWLTEKQICDQLEAILQPNKDGVLLREMPIYNLHTPDYILIHKSKNKLIVMPIEVKITATIESIKQIAKYSTILKHISKSLEVESKKSKLKPEMVKFADGLLIARYFDENIKEVAQMIGWHCARLVTREKTILEVDILENEIKKKLFSNEKEPAYTKVSDLIKSYGTALFQQKESE
jgi:hypothetical protein